MNIGIFIARLIIITPSCLRVESAMIFFMSHSVVALRPAISVVSVAMISREEENLGHSFREG